MPHRKARIRVGWRQGLSMAGPYLRQRLGAQAAAILPVVAYLVIVRTFVLGMPLRDGLSLALGVLASAIGLAAFLEGLFLGIMPLGEAAGLSLPRKAGIAASLIFAFILGAVATLAEPAIGFLKSAGSGVLPWRAPLLYHLLNRGSSLLVLAICVGVGLAVGLGLLRFLRRWRFRSLLPFAILPVLAASALAAFHPQLRLILGLAWDSGGITTGPVTVPLILALGLGMTRASGGEDAGSAEGLGVVTIASAFPVLAVIVLGFILSPALPAPAEPEAFFAPSNRSAIEPLFRDAADLDARARAALGDDAWAALQSAEGVAPSAPALPPPGAETAKPVLLGHLRSSLQAILPLPLLLMAMLLAYRVKLRSRDEIILGLFLAFAGMFLFNIGMEKGLASLGQQTGRALPSSFTAIPDPSGEVAIQDFRPDIVERAINPSGQIKEFFWLDAGKASPLKIDYDEELFDPAAGTYRFTPSIGPRFSGWGGGLGILILIILAFFLGYGATIAEPSLAALGSTVEELTVGTFRRSWLIAATALGVGLGAALGIIRVLFDVPLMALLLPAYALILLLTAFSQDDIAALAWDSAGVTTGPVTVPLVIAMGLGVGGTRGVVDSFGILACASAFPVATVLVFGLWLKHRRAGSPHEEEAAK